MQPDERQDLLETIRHFKEPGCSDLDAALNLVTSHADTIKILQGEVDSLRSKLRSLGAAAINAAHEKETS